MGGSVLRREIAVLLALLGALVAAPAAQAATITVNTADDTSADSTKCALRDALLAADQNMPTAGTSCEGGDANPATDVIDATGVTGTITLDTLLPNVSGNTDIQGPGASQLTVSGNDARRVFLISTSTVVSMSGITIAHGQAGFGGGIDNEGTLTLTNAKMSDNVASATGSSPTGGGIFNNGTLHLVASEFNSNKASSTNGPTTNSAAGGGVYNSNNGTLTVDRSSFVSNSASADAMGGNETLAFGGGIHNAGVLTVGKSTFTHNSAEAKNGTVDNTAYGGAIAMGAVMGAKTSIERSTLAGNAASSPGFGGGAIYAAEQLSVTSSTIVGNSAPSIKNQLDGAVSLWTLRNTIVAQPVSGGNCSPGSASGGYNLEDDMDASCGFSAAKHDIVGQDPLLDPAGLADNGSSPQTIGLQTGSPAIDKGLSGKTETTDQRGTGFIRPSDFSAKPNGCGDGSDIGAFEVQGGAPDKAPGTSLYSKPRSVVHHRRVRFRFRSTESCSKFQCKLDRRSWSYCSSPKSYSVRRGSHRFRVRSIDPGGSVDPTPSSKRFRRV